MTGKKTTKSRASKRKGAQKSPPKRGKAKATKQAATAGARGRDHGLKPGQVLERRFKGKDLRLQVTASGFLLDGTEYASLTSAAKAATSYPSVSGVRFWLGAGDAKGGAK